jgi:hypothetical protein
MKTNALVLLLACFTPLLLWGHSMVSPIAGIQQGIYVAGDDQYISIGNPRIGLTFRKRDGTLYSIVDKASGVDFIKDKSELASNYRAEWYVGSEGRGIGAWMANTFTYDVVTTTTEITLTLIWSQFRTDSSTLNMTVTLAVHLSDESPLMDWRMNIQNDEDIAIQRVVFVIDGLRQISDDPAQDYLVYPSYAGLLIQDPEHAFLEPFHGWGWEMYYPSAYSTMQFLAYYSLEKNAGLYLTTQDNEGYSKSFYVVKFPSGWFRIEVYHELTYTPGNDFESPYPLVLGVFSGDWYDAAEIYRSWAIRQPWASRGTLDTRMDVPQWYKDLSMHEISWTHTECQPVFQPYSMWSEVAADASDYLGVPVGIMWWGWENQGWYINYPDVFPPDEGWGSFVRTIDDIHAQGNRIWLLLDVASYSSRLGSWKEARQSAVVNQLGPFGTYGQELECGLASVYVTMCPGTDFWKEKLSWLILTLVSKGVDVIALDGFPVNSPQPCTASHHTHPSGGGNWWYRAYNNIFQEIKDQARAINPNVVYGTEGMAEPYISLVDSFFDISDRANGGAFDATKVQVIPLWQTVYHDYALLYDGISAFYCCPTLEHSIKALGTTLTWGEIPGIWNPGRQFSTMQGDDRVIAEYLKRVVQARSFYAKKFLVYGRMLRPPKINASSSTATRLLTKLPDDRDLRVISNVNLPLPSGIAGTSAIPQSPAIVDNPSVLSSLWKAPDGSAGYVFTNVSHTPVSFTLSIEAQNVELPPDEAYAIYEIRNGSYRVLHYSVRLPQVLNVSISPRDILVVVVSSEAPQVYYLPVIMKNYRDYP